MASERFSLNDRMPDTPAEIVVEELASATWCVLHSTWASHDMEDHDNQRKEQCDNASKNFWISKSITADVSSTRRSILAS